MLLCGGMRLSSEVALRDSINALVHGDVHSSSDCCDDNDVNHLDDETIAVLHETARQSRANFCVAIGYHDLCIRRSPWRHIRR